MLSDNIFPLSHISHQAKHFDFLPVSCSIKVFAFHQEANMFRWIRTILCIEYEIKYFEGGEEKLWNISGVCMGEISQQLDSLFVMCVCREETFKEFLSSCAKLLCFENQWRRKGEKVYLRLKKLSLGLNGYVHKSGYFSSIQAYKKVNANLVVGLRKVLPELKHSESPMRSSLLSQAFIYGIFIPSRNVNAAWFVWFHWNAREIQTLANFYRNSFGIYIYGIHPIQHLTYDISMRILKYNYEIILRSIECYQRINSALFKSSYPLKYFSIESINIKSLKVRANLEHQFCIYVWNMKHMKRSF